VLPLKTGVTNPEELTEATEGLSELQEEEEVTSWEEPSEK
jgi:hypothetical protein